MMKGIRIFRVCAFCAGLTLAAFAAHGAASTFEATTDSDNNGYNGTVKAGGDGYAFTAEDVIVMQRWWQ